MDEKELFEQGCFLPCWAEDDVKLSTAYKSVHKDLPTLMNELEEIKEKIQEIQARQWALARKILYHENELAKE